MKAIVVLLGLAVIITACNSEVETISEFKTEKIPKTKIEKKGYFSLFDTNDNGIISKDEFAAYIVIAYAKKDANNDGEITRDECTHFDILNTDGNDVISDEEFENNNGKIFVRMDANNDELVTEDELKTHLKEMKKERADIK